ncbi:hypothetical protein L596_002818 [Steinernema carpocapsae]|uniref:Uncharacterized protein n=1 Tax=Steinernema carpocapsae TaxID=34508 RepID=A0A4U8UT98_STECR|nr:hypothetical protein L596_002818 [Steinernema carpocapsae]
MNKSGSKSTLNANSKTDFLTLSNASVDDPIEHPNHIGVSVRPIDISLPRSNWDFHAQTRSTSICIRKNLT